MAPSVPPGRGRARSRVWDYVPGGAGEGRTGAQLRSRRPRPFRVATATPLYEEIVAAGGIEQGRPPDRRRGPDRPAFDLLIEIGLLTADRRAPLRPPSTPPRSSPGSCRRSARRAPGCWRSRRAGPDAFGPLAQAWRRSPDTGRGPFTLIRTPRRSTPSSPAWSPSARRRCSPPSRRPAATRTRLAAARQRDTAMLERGTRMRTLYQHSARRSAITHNYVAAVTARGAEVRTLDEFFNRMIVIDRRVAVIPGAGGPAAPRSPSASRRSSPTSSTSSSGPGSGPARSR